MAVHNMLCPSCGLKFEALRIEQVSCPSCGVLATWQPSVMISTFKSFYHPHLGHTPVLIESAKQLDKELDKRNLYIPQGKKQGPRRLPQSIREAKEGF